MKDAFKMIAATGAFCIVAGLLLAWTDDATRLPRQAAKKAELIAGIKKVLPDCDNDVLTDTNTVEHAAAPWIFYVGKKEGKCVGVAFKCSSRKGYGGAIDVLVGVLPDGTINGIEITQMKETPGLGTKASEPAFKNRFKGKLASEAAKWCKVTKDGGEIQAITGATITSRAVTEAVRAGLEVFAMYSEQIMK